MDTLKYKLAHLIPFYPLIQLIRIQWKWGVVRPQRMAVVFIWLAKTLLFEPLRWVDTLVVLLLPKKKVKLIYIIGYYRSGTTYLQELMSLDKKHTTVTLFDSVMPEVTMCFGWLLTPFFNGMVRLFRISNQYHYVPFRFDFPGEEDVAINALSTFADYNRVYQYPSKHTAITKEVLIDASTSTKRAFLANYELFLKKVAYRSNSKIIILKSPPNLARTAILKGKFPDSKFIHIHRNPKESIRSNKRLWDLNRSFSFENYSDSDVYDVIQYQFQSFYKAFKRDQVPMDCTITFSELIADPLETISKVYSSLELEGFGLVKDHIQVKQSNAMQISRPNKTMGSDEFELSAETLAIANELGYSRLV